MHIKEKTGKEPPENARCPPPYIELSNAANNAQKLWQAVSQNAVLSTATDDIKGFTALQVLDTQRIKPFLLEGDPLQMLRRYKVDHRELFQVFATVFYIPVSSLVFCFSSGNMCSNPRVTFPHHPPSSPSGKNQRICEKNSNYLYLIKI